MPGRRTVSNGRLNERAFHRWIATHLPAGRGGPLPLGDDAAALRPPPGSVAVLTTDALIEGTHFLATSSARAIGAAAAGVSLSDAAAKGARPAGILIALTLPATTPRAWPEGVVRGAEAMGARFGAHVIGGDTKPSSTRTVVSTVIGWGDPHTLAPRTAARPGDLLVTTGSVGRGGVAWRRFQRSGPRTRKAALAGLLDVRPRVEEGCALAPLAHAMIDTSDGIADSSHLLAAASGVRIVLDSERIPWDRSLRSLSATERWTVGFFGGDYELLAAIPPRHEVRAMRAVAAVGGPLRSIGRVERGQGVYGTTARGVRPLPRAGWRPFERHRAPPAP